MGSVYKRGSIWWLAYLDATGKRVLRSADTRDERIARQRLEAVESSASLMASTSTRPTTVAAWAATWSAARVNWNKKADLGQLTNHVLPILGSRRMIDVTQDDVRALVSSWTTLAPRTVRNIFWVMSRMFSDAVRKKLIEVSPCQLVKGDRPRIADKDRRWRKGAVFTRPEAEQLITSELVPADRHILWALGFAAGLRLGEVSGLRWRDYDEHREVLGCLNITTSYTRINGAEKATKTETPREVPVHPTLAAELASWRALGWEKLVGRPPTPTDLVLPNRTGAHLTDNNVYDGRTKDFAALEMRRRRFHDARRTFISLAQAGGASKDVLQLITHGSPGEVIDQYTTLPWATLCEAVLCLKLERRGDSPPPLLQQPLQFQGDRVQLVKLLNDLSCPRRDSNPRMVVSPGLVLVASQRSADLEPGGPNRSPDGDCSNRSNPNSLAARAQLLLASYAKAGAR